MSQIVRIEVCLPEGHWAGEATRTHPNAVLQIIETMPLGKGRGTAQIASEQNLLDDLENLRGIERVEIWAVAKPVSQLTLLQVAVTSNR